MERQGTGRDENNTELALELVPRSERPPRQSAAFLRPYAGDSRLSALARLAAALDCELVVRLRPPASSGVLKQQAPVDPPVTASAEVVLGVS